MIPSFLIGSGEDEAMTTEPTDTGILREIGPYRWEIPQGYKPGMRVPGRVYSSREMLHAIARDQVLDQVANVATLPGIVGASLAMPDIHWGYGFPVGGVAAMRVMDGVISPGGIGYDINCLPGSSRILHEFGYHRPIADFARRWPVERIKCLDRDDRIRDTAIVGYLEKPWTADELLKLTSETGREIRATAEHPLLTPDWMVPLGSIEIGDRVSVYPFEGVPYEEPEGDVLVTEVHIAAAYPGPATGLTQTIRALHDRGLLPLRMDHPKLPYLIKLMGFIQGDGSLTFLRGGGALVAFYGVPVDLEDIRQDVLELGFVPSRIYQRTRSHRIDSRYRGLDFRCTESSVHCGSMARAVLLHCLGVVAGNKTKQAYGLPSWLNRAPSWMKRLYLAALFGAELSSPQAVSGHFRNLVSPVLSQNKAEAVVEDGRRYLTEIQGWLGQFGVESSLLRSSSREEHVGRNGNVSLRLRLQVSGTPENLVRLWSRIGFEYNRRKQYLANVATHYLRLKMLALEERRMSIELARELHMAGAGVEAIVASVGSPYVSARFVERSLWETRKTGARVGSVFPDFPSFLEECRTACGQSGRVWDRVVRIEPVPLTCPVHDFTVRDSNHNFIADGVVVSNCGVRLLATDLNAGEIKPRIHDLADVLYKTVPAGVGGSTQVRVRSRNDFEQVLREGAQWAVKAGYGFQHDLERIEESGRLRGADPGVISDRARDRGMKQIGSLGSGNHFMEVQRVDELYDDATAEAFGLWKGQVVIFIHTGSRGFGHQVCTDSLHDMAGASKRYGIELPDRQLACAPIRSDEGQGYLSAMACAANFAWANRQCLTHWARQAMAKVFGQQPEAIRLVYDVSHNIAKFESYEVDGESLELCVHRKGATRAFPSGHPDLSPSVRSHGQPVFIPGDMGRYSYVAVGTEEAIRESFGSTCHGAGRMQSRGAAKRALAGVDIASELKKQGIIVRAQNPKLLAEEASEAYKDVADVVDVVEGAGISRKVARMRPLAVIKG